MGERMVSVDKKELVYKEFHNIRELLEILMSEHAPSKFKIKAKPDLSWSPPMDVFETETDFVVIMDIAGMQRKDIGVFTDGKILRILGVREEISQAGKKQFHSMEIEVGPFQRFIRIPVPVESQSISTSYSNGFLEVRLKRTFESTEKKKIEVE
ncbi:MAG: Hsp20 family protein [Candidatus Latescibacteria bacterium]|nr:Hsp20 family protein [Candidatus Latescibacterota bacterium]NIM20913.1 Hsp20 family protein [Candidatus Latescibacterota bacterium]NIM65048.1 Hsp20 family protein [Candidatus Latescibacterota bacterium]NIO01563.1 Hsp20 family protein [Candidatus Latescibacterota bacterium]NIO28080.1 Hsp20 family protein [Candidatus Latescibacterota bacterium]